MSHPLQALLDQGVAEGIFPAARAVVLHRGEVAFNGGAGGPGEGALFDLASLTKPISTAAIFLSFWKQGALSPQTPLAEHLPDAQVARDGATFEDLLLHRSGLSAFLPFFAKVMRWYPRLFEPDCASMLRDEASKDVLRLARAVVPERRRGQHALYSDIGYLLLGEALAHVGGAPLDALFADRVAQPLGLGAHFRRLSAPSPRAEGLLPTGLTRPRDPAPGQAGLWDPFEPHASPAGEVDDDNAWCLDGVAGHAGLFGTALDVARFGQEVLDGLAGKGKLAPADLWSRMVEPDRLTPGSTRTLAFDTPSSSEAGSPPSAGQRLGNQPPGAVGHLGFTGCSLWVDLARSLVVGLCTNRTFLGRAEVRIRTFRPRFHDAVVEALGL